MTEVLESSVSDGVVDYPVLCADPRISRLGGVAAAIDLSGASESERLSALINGYNLLAAEAILAGGSPRTLLGRYGFFMRTLHPFAGESITLWDLEHERIRPLGEPRIHFALVCASASCPKLQPAGYSARADELENQLDAATRAFINDPARNVFDLDAGAARVSAIFDWYREDFEASGQSLAEYIAEYVEDPEIADALRSGALAVEFVRYDWRLNGVSPGPGGRCSNRP
jgi:hypothetical protein